MGLRLEVIQFLDNANTSVVQRIPPDGTADIKYGAQLIVASAQEAVFFRDGKAMDTFGPGRFTLTTANIPLITRILTIPWEKSPFQACVYFIGKQTFLDQKWGTRQPITFRDREFGVVRLRSFGKYSFRVADSALLLNTLVGTQGKYTTEDVTSFQRDLIVSRMTDLMGSLNFGLLDLAARYDEIAAGVRAKVAEDFAKYGLELVDLFINAITPPDEVQKAIDARSSMSVVGDMNSFVKYQTANSMSKMAEQGGGASGPMGFGLGAGFGMMFPGMFHGTMAANAPPGAAGSGQYQPPQSPGNTLHMADAPERANAPHSGPVAGSAAAPVFPGAAGQGGSGGSLTGYGVGSASTPAPLDFGSLAPVSISPVELVKQVAAAANYPLTEGGEGMVITVPIGTLRKQKVRVGFGVRDENGNELVSFRSTCGPVTEKNALTLLRFNARMVHGAFAVEKLGEGETLVIQANLLTEMLNPAAVTQVLSAIAWQADQVEEKLGGGDAH
jgi:membrane protease subunit (stomatin/prohibitin family)